MSYFSQINSSLAGQLIYYLVC